jgi:hypothetical protein
VEVVYHPANNNSGVACKFSHPIFFPHFEPPFFILPPTYPPSLIPYIFFLTMSVVGIDLGAQSTKIGVARNKGIDIVCTAPRLPNLAGSFIPLTANPARIAKRN